MNSAVPFVFADFAEPAKRLTEETINNDAGGLLEQCFNQLLEEEEKQEAQARNLSSHSGDFGEQNASGAGRAGSPPILDVCLHAEHEQPCKTCPAPPRERDVGSFELVGCEGKKNGSKLLRTRMARSRQWNDPNTRRETAKIAFHKGHKRLGKALADGRSADLRKEDMLILCGLWGLRSNIWRRRGPQISTEATDEEISSQTVAADTNAAAPGSFSKLSGMGGGAAPAAAAALGFTLDRSAICIAADPAGLLVAMQFNTVPRLKEIGESVIRVHITAGQEISPFFPRSNIVNVKMAEVSRTIVHRTRPGLGCALERLRTSTARRELQAQLLGPAASGFARGAEQMAAEDPKAEEFITVIHDSFTVMRDMMLQAKAERSTAVASGAAPADPALERWEDGYVHNFASQVEIMGTLLRVLGAAKAQDLSGREAYIGYLQVVTAALDFIYAYNTRLGGAQLLRADWLDASLERLRNGGGGEDCPPPDLAAGENDPAPMSMVCLQLFIKNVEEKFGKLATPTPAMAATPPPQQAVRGM